MTKETLFVGHVEIFIFTNIAWEVYLTFKKIVDSQFII